MKFKLNSFLIFYSQKKFQIIRKKIFLQKKSWKKKLIFFQNFVVSRKNMFLILIFLLFLSLKIFNANSEKRLFQRKISKTTSVIGQNSQKSNTILVEVSSFSQISQISAYQTVLVLNRSWQELKWSKLIDRHSKSILGSGYISAWTFS